MTKDNRNYQSSDIIYRPSDESAMEIPKNLIGTYADPSLWAYSTLPPGDYKDLVCAHTIIQGKLKQRETVRQRIWLHDILDDEGILYQIVIKGYWASRKTYAENQFIYIEKKHRKKVKQLIQEFRDPSNSVMEIPDAETSPDDFVDGVLQIKCPSCGKKIDFDYTKCPHCKGSVS